VHESVSFSSRELLLLERKPRDAEFPAYLIVILCAELGFGGGERQLHAYDDRIAQSKLRRYFEIRVCFLCLLLPK